MSLRDACSTRGKDASRTAIDLGWQMRGAGVHVG